MSEDRTPSTTPVRVAIVGCGAVAQLYYAPALRTLEREGLITLSTVHDPDLRAVQLFRNEFRSAFSARSIDELLDREPQLVIVASPPSHHAEHTIAALRAGADVHCEKPLAPTAAEGELMVAAAAGAGRRLSVGLVRRHFPATQVIGRLLAAGTLGDLRSVECFEGGPFEWPIRSADSFRRSAGGVGLLHDIGTHCVDLLVWWLGLPTEVAYEDDAMGGIEANCRIDLRFESLTATVRLSRDWARPNRYVITGTDGWIDWTVNDSNDLHLGLRGAPGRGLAGEHFATALELHRGTSTTGGGGLRCRAATFEEAFTDQLRALTEDQHERRWVAAEAALPTMRILDECLARRRTMSMPWLQPDEGAWA